MVEYGKLLDREDKERVRPLRGSDPEAVDPDRVRKELLGKHIAGTRARGGTTLLRGPESANPAAVLPFLLFYPIVGVEVCQQCPQAKNPALLEPLLETDSATVIMVNYYSKMPEAFQKLAWRYHDSFVGCRSFDLFRDITMYHSLQDLGGGGWVCNHCLGKAKNRCNALAQHFTERDRENVTSTIEELSIMPRPIASAIVERLETGLEEKRVDDLAALARTADFINYSGSCRAIGGTPQMSEAMLGVTQLYAEALRIDMPPNVPFQKYLEVIQNHRGALNPNTVSQRPDEILPEVDRINSEIREIEGSHKLAIGRILAFKIVPALASMGSAYATHGILSHEIGREVATQISRSATSEASVKFLSKFFGTDEEIIHIWQIRDQLRSVRMSGVQGS